MEIRKTLDTRKLFEALTRISSRLRHGSGDETLLEILSTLGSSVDVDRTYLFDFKHLADQNLSASQLPKGIYPSTAAPLARLKAAKYFGRSSGTTRELIRASAMNHMGVMVPVNTKTRLYDRKFIENAAISGRMDANTSTGRNPQNRP